MKKLYETPMVEKITFNYRDQVVAASGENESSSGTNTGSNSRPGLGDFLGYLFNLATSGCDDLFDWFG